MKSLYYLGGFVLLIACSDPGNKSSEEKASDMTKSLLKEMKQKDSANAAIADTSAAKKIK